MKVGRLVTAAQKVLSDGEWHPKSDVSDAMAKAVPFGHAQRAAQNRSLRGDNPETQVVRGQQYVAGRKLSEVISRGRFEEKTEDGVRYVRDVYAGTHSVRDVAKLLGRSTSSVHGWINDKDLYAEVQALCPDGVLPGEQIRGLWAVSDAALPAWREFSAKRTRLRPIDRDAMAQVVAAVFDLDESVALEKLAKLRKALRTQGYSILSRNLKATKEAKKNAPPTESDADASSQQGATD